MDARTRTGKRRVIAGVAGRVTYANVAATLALIVALGTGGAYAAGQITAKDIAKNAVRAKHIKKNQVTTPKIKNGAVTAAKLADGATVRGFNYQTPPTGTTATLFSLNGLTVTASCVSGQIGARTSVDNAYISASWVTPGSVPVGNTDMDFDTTDTFDANLTTGAKTGSLEYVRPDGHRVSVSLQAKMNGDCTVSGHAFASG